MPVSVLSRVAARRRLAWLRRSAAASTLTLAMLHSAPEARAQTPVAVGPEFQINTYTTSTQSFQSVATDTDGDFVVAWQSRDQDGDHYGVFAQRFAADGIPQGGEFQVSTHTANRQRHPDIGMDADGNFVVAWTSRYQDGDGFGIFAQRFAADGTPQGGEFQVNTHTTSDQLGPSVGMDADGDFVVAWGGQGQHDSTGVFAQRFAADSTPQGGEFQVNAYTTSLQFYPSVAMNAGGDFVIAWESWGQDGQAPGIFAQRFAADGTPEGEEFPVNTHTTGHQGNPSAAIDADGSFVVAWRSADQDGDRNGIFAQRFAAGGTPEGEEFSVNTYTTSDQFSPSVAMDADGNFVVAWESYLQDGDLFGVFAQRFTADGVPQGLEFPVNTYTARRQSLPSVSIDPEGGFIVAWTSGGQDGDDYGIFAKRYTASPVANEDNAPLPTALALDAVFPNPIRDAATLRYALPTTAAVRLTVTDVLGRTVLTRAEGMQPAGEHEARLALDDLPSGVYVVRLDADGATATQRVTVVR